MRMRRIARTAPGLLGDLPSSALSFAFLYACSVSMRASLS